MTPIFRGRKILIVAPLLASLLLACSSDSDQIQQPTPGVEQSPARPAQTARSVVGTYCEVRQSGMSSDVRGINWTVITYRQWSDGSSDIAGTNSVWSFTPPSC
jgi:hypothetical protein